ncbi:hypothetical protein [Bacillus sp. FJAT-29814]|uniref:hypothetical protein n=1 Tax=Bacillus sp. FJAT-29814 TaxID=1729688 RepID=UPI000830EF63|nr:hypothetical protein [Bacillus sp. FJAT-29814]
MGTSKKNMNNEIKKMLKEKPLDQLNVFAPDISKVVLSQESLTKSLDNEEVVNTTIEVVTKRFISLGNSGYKGKTKKEIIEDELTQQEFLEMILKEIEDGSKINSKVLEKALKIVMTQLLEEESFDVYVFSQLLFYQVVYQLLLSELYETLKDSYEDLSYIQIKKMVTSLTDKIMNNEVCSKVNDFVDRKVSFSNLLEVITKATDNAEFGVF